MSKLLLLVQSERDVAHLDAAARAILNTSITGVWVIYSPAITVSTNEAAAKLDAEIAELAAHERAAANREDYTAAAGYKTNREEKTLDRAKALRDAWKTASAEERTAKTKELIGPFVAHLKPAGLNVRITGHSDHYDREQWVAMLNSLSGVWFKEFTPGSFVVAWPESVETAMKLQQAKPDPANDLERNRAIRAAESDKKQSLAEAAVAMVKINAPRGRKEELEAMHHSTVKKTARELGIETLDKSVPALIDAIVAAESAPAPAPETVDAY